jgi:Mor family transcriptional regulator
MDKVEIRAAINARRYLTPKALAKRYKCSLSAIYRLERVME